MEKIQLALSIFAAIASLIAIGVSIYANHISGKAQQLALDGFNAERRIALRTLTHEDRIEFKPLEESQQVHDITIFFPSRLDIGPIAATPPELFVYYTRINPQVQRYIEKQIPAKKDYAQVVLNYPVPALILLHGYSKGYASMSAGLYDFIFEVNRLEDGANIRLKSAVLNNFQYQVDDPQALIDSLFEQLVAQTSNPALQGTLRDKASQLP
jgi:hypothetical protein